MFNDKIDIVMEHEKETKGSNRWGSIEPGSDVPTLYIRKPHFHGVKRIRVTVEQVKYIDEPLGET